MYVPLYVVDWYGVWLVTHNTIYLYTYCTCSVSNNNCTEYAKGFNVQIWSLSNIDLFPIPSE